MRFIVAIDRDEDGIWVVECPAIPGSVSQGTTKEEALANVDDAIRACLQSGSSFGDSVTPSTIRNMTSVRRFRISTGTSIMRGQLLVKVAITLRRDEPGRVNIAKQATVFLNSFHMV